MNSRNPFIIILLSAALMTIASFAWAEPGRGGRGGPPGATEKLAWMSDRLALSDEQAQAILPILQTAEAEQQAIRQQGIEDMAPEICASREKTHVDIAAILTAEQLADFEVMVEKGRDRMKKHRGGRGEGPVDCSGVDSVDS